MTTSWHRVTSDSKDLSTAGTATDKQVVMTTSSSSSLIFVYFTADIPHNLTLLTSATQDGTRQRPCRATLYTEGLSGNWQATNSAQRLINRTASSSSSLVGILMAFTDCIVNSPNCALTTRGLWTEIPSGPGVNP